MNTIPFQSRETRSSTVTSLSTEVLEDVKKTPAGLLLAGNLVTGRKVGARLPYCTAPRKHTPLGAKKVSNQLLLSFSRSSVSLSYANSAKSL